MTGVAIGICVFWIAIFLRIAFGARGKARLAANMAALSMALVALVIIGLHFAQVQA